MISGCILSGARGAKALGPRFYFYQVRPVFFLVLDTNEPNMSRLQICSVVVLSLVLASTSGSQETKPGLEEIKGVVIDVNPKLDRIVVHYEPTPGDNQYFYVRPKEQKTKLFIGDKEAAIGEFKDKDVVVLTLDTKAKMIVEMRLFKAGATKGGGVKGTPLFVGPKGLVIQAFSLEATDAKDAEKKGPSKTFLVALKRGVPYLISLSSKKFDPYLRVESFKGEPIASDHKTGGPGKAQIVFEPKEDVMVRLVATSFDGAGTGTAVVSVREQKK
jgi:hypothetical protein